MTHTEKQRHNFGNLSRVFGINQDRTRTHARATRWMRRIVLVCALLAQGVIWASGPQGVLAYEGFEYSSGGNLAGHGGGTGWSGNWLDVGGGGGNTVMGGNLLAGTNAPPGFDDRSTSNSVLIANQNRAGRFLDTSATGPFGLSGLVDGSGNIGANGSTIYISFLQKPSTTVKFYEFEFKRGSLGDGGRIGGIGNDTSNTNVHLRIQSPPGGGSAYYDLGPGNTNVNFYVVRINFTSTNDAVIVYRNPTNTNEGGNIPTVTVTNAGDMSFNGLSLAAYVNGVSVRHDQIRVGKTWADVVGGPPAFITQPTGFTSGVGATNSLSAVAVSDQTIRYQWLRNDVPIPNATNSTLEFADMQVTNSGIYNLSASNALGLSISMPATIIVTNGTVYPFVIAYEGFDYTVGNALAGAAGGIGWSNGWVDISGNLGETVIAGSLSSAGAAPAGFEGRSTGNAANVSNGSRCGRWLDCSSTGAFAQVGLLDADGNIGLDGQTVYLSFLQQPSSSGRFYEFELHRNDLGDAGRIAAIGNDVPDSTQVYLRAPGATLTPMGVGNTGVNFYIVRIEFKPGNDDVYVYRNPTDNLESGNEPVLSMLSVADMSFDGLSIGAFLNGVTVKNDEIRLGQTWASVLGNPPAFVVQPTSQALYAGQPVTLTSLAQSTQSLSYQWYFGTNALAGRTNANLSLSSAQLSDAGQYYVTASNSLGLAVSSTAALTISPVTVAITSPPIMIVGSDLFLQGSVGGALPLSLQWFKDGAAIGGATNANYVLSNSTVFDAGIYSLVVENSYGSVTSSVVSVVSSSGGLLAYEGFNYGQTTADITGANGGFGWMDAWVNVGGNSSQSFSNSLTGGANVPAGYDSHSLNGHLFSSNGSRKGRYIDCSATGPFGRHGFVDGNGNVGADGKTLYLGFLQRSSGASKFYEFELHRGDLGDGGRMGGVGNDTGDANAHLRVQSPPGGGAVQYNLGAGNTNVNFYVVRIDFKSGNDDIFVYRNPTSATEPGAPSLAVMNAADMSFDGISLAAYDNGISVSHDEVRIGMTWADVVGGSLSPLQLKLVGRSNALSTLRVAGAPNFTFGLQAATNVVGPWTNIGSVSVSSSGVGQFSETNSSERRYYRATNPPVWIAPLSANIYADFEQPTYGDWLTTGTAFGAGPAQGSLSGQSPVTGYVGSGLVNSFLGGDGSVGTLTSPPFVISKPYLNFLIGGGNNPGQTCLNLVISNVVVMSASGANSEVLSARQWDVSSYIGQTAILQIIDSAIGSWGHILVDQIAFSDSAVPSLSRTMLLTNTLLNLPIQNGAPLRRVTVTVGGQPVRDFKTPLASGGTPDWWAFVDVAAFSNQVATLSVSSVSTISDGFYSVIQTNGIVGGTNLYQETLRPQLHFSSKRGWLNDANGMIYHGGKYHLYYQHDPFNWAGNDQKYWGHAVSQDMVNWTELQEAIYPHSYNDWVWSGSTVVDADNTSGFKTGTNDVIVAAFTSTGRGECIAYSNDGGLTFSDYTNNPVVVHSGRDPHLLWYAPSNYWVMVVYNSTGGNNFSFYTSPNLKQWTYRSKLNGFFECPDLFEMPLDGDNNDTRWITYDAGSGYMVGQFDGATFTPLTTKLSGNSGSGFYAAQTFTTMPPGDTRRIRIGWAINDVPGMPFNQLMYFPTELKLKTTSNGIRLFNTPIAEITNNIVTSYVWTNLTLNAGNNPLSGIRGSLFDVRAQFSVGTAQLITFTIQGVTVTYNALSQQISCNGVVNSLAPVSGILQLEIITDRETIEIFGNDGELYMPLPASPNTGGVISIGCSGGSAFFNSLIVNKLQSIWPKP